MNFKFFVFLMLPLMVAAQPPKPAFRLDLEYKNPSFPNQSLLFGDTIPFFYLQSGKGKFLKIPAPAKFDLAYQLGLVRDKKLKITAEDLLLIQAGWEEWTKFRRTIGFEMQESGLGIKILKQGKGELPSVGQNVRVHYVGTLEDGTKFDSSRDRGEPFEFPLGMGRVIRGWDEGIAKLRKGTTAILLIPAHLGYGARGAGGVIPPNATLYFEVEVLE